MLTDTNEQQKDWWENFGTPDSDNTPPAPDAVSHEAVWRHGYIKVKRQGANVVITLFAPQNIRVHNQAILIAVGAKADILELDPEDAIQIANIIAAAARWTPDR